LFIIAQGEVAMKVSVKLQKVDASVVYYCSTYYKAVRLGGGG
jgi:hypothetical protein